MKICLFIAFAVVYVSCKSPVKTPIGEMLKNSDSVVVQFYSEKEVLENAATSSEPAAITQLIRYIDSQRMDSGTCIKGGQIIFYDDKKEVERVIYRPDCKLFEFVINDKKQYTLMSDGAVNFINAIEKGER
jgi:hypothetical protein